MNYFKNNATILIINVIVSKKLMKVSFLAENDPIEIMKTNGIMNVVSIKLKPINRTKHNVIVVMLDADSINICFFVDNELCL